MPRSGPFGKAATRKKQSKQTSTPETADDYLAVGVDFEEAGEKWRAGDAAKSARFFIRAIDTYNEALKRFPDSFDLAYNKARVQYEITQYPKLAAQFPDSIPDPLETALESSRYALNLGQDNADALFNTAQVITSLVEATIDNRSDSAAKKDGVGLLEEAIELFQRCLVLQEYQYAEFQAQEEAVAPVLSSDEVRNLELQQSSVGHASDFANGGKLDSSSSTEERWATIVEPVTNDTLLDTVLAQLEALTSLCGLISADTGRGLAWIEEYTTALVNDKLSAYVQGTNRAREADIARATCVVSLAHANFRCGGIDALTYGKALMEVLASLDLSNDPEGLCEKAEALIVYNSSLNLSMPDTSEVEWAVSSKWKALTDALEALTAASKLPSASNLAKIHLLRGDVELLRYQLGQPPIMFEAAMKNAATLVRNAGTYYRGAEAHGIAAGLEDEVEEAVVKGAIAAGIQGNSDKLRELMKTNPETSRRLLEESVDEGFVGVDWLIAAGIIRD